MNKTRSKQIQAQLPEDMDDVTIIDVDLKTVYFKLERDESLDLVDVHKYADDVWAYSKNTVEPVNTVAQSVEDGYLVMVMSMQRNLEP